MKRLKPEVRKLEILEAMLPLAEKHGYEFVTRNMIGEALGITGNAVQYHFGAMGALRNEFMRFAVRNEILPIIAQGVARGEKRALRAPEELKVRAVQSLL